MRIAIYGTLVLIGLMLYANSQSIIDGPWTLLIPLVSGFLLGIWRAHGETSPISMRFWIGIIFVALGFFALFLGLYLVFCCGIAFAMELWPENPPNRNHTFEFIAFWCPWGILLSGIAFYV